MPFSTKSPLGTRHLAASVAALTLVLGLSAAVNAQTPPAPAAAPAAATEAPPPAPGTVLATVNGNPIGAGSTGRIWYFTDETMVIRENPTQPASSTDPSI